MNPLSISFYIMFSLVFSAVFLLFGCRETGPAPPGRENGKTASEGDSGPSPADPFAQVRQEMVENQIQSRGIRDPRVLAALRRVPRHLFVPESVRSYAYSDGPVPIGSNQTISQPYIVAYMTEQARLRPDDRVLEVGTGSGYQAAILAELVREVYTIELLPELGRTAAARLERLGYRNVHCRIGDGYLGWPEAAPFDAILVTAAPESVPPELVRQIRPGGRMIIPVGLEQDIQALLKVEKDADGRVRQTDLLPVRFVPLVPGNKNER